MKIAQRIIAVSLLVLVLLFSKASALGIPLTVIGTTSPDALVTVRIPRAGISQPKLADQDGHFIFTFNNIERGVYEMTITAVKDGSANEITQLIGISESEEVTEVTLSEINIPLTPVKQIKKERADFNKGGGVNLVDLSILMYYWGTPMFYRAYNPEIDLNGDRTVDIHDFSLMLAHWTS